MKPLILAVVLILTGCSSKRTGDTAYPEAIQVQVKDDNGNLHWKCIAVSGGGVGNNAIPANLDVWTPDNLGRCLIPKGK